MSRSSLFRSYFGPKLEVESSSYVRMGPLERSSHTDNQYMQDAERDEVHNEHEKGLRSNVHVSGEERDSGEVMHVPPGRIGLSHKVTVV
jgi:hypothetical protein